ncbi:MAG: hypothetical protein KGD73_11735, partial [Candidatus Lokiarchaeota archaeon]|nr:hypothetical protein [Candidatus Lokiarchaeota archaeon]
FMEFPLFIYRIRPTGLPFLIFEVFFLFNQGAPYLYILQIEVFPFLNKKIKYKKEKKVNEISP